MELSTQQRVQIGQLLLQREAAYVRVHEIEAEINRLLGDTYPFPPPQVPVAVGKAVQNKPKRQPTNPSTTAPKLRPLQDSESAYLISFRQDGGELPERHVDRKSVLKLLQSELGQSMIERIEIIDSNGTVVDCLWPIAD